MKATLYDALGISPTSSEEEVRAALRGLIRKYYAKTRDGQGNVEEALRFINHASRILSDNERRERYDNELTRSADGDDKSSTQLVNEALLGDDEHTDVGEATAPGDQAMADPLDSSRRAETPANSLLHHPGLTERVASFSRSPILTFGLCGLFATFIAAAIVFVTPADVVVVAQQVLGWLFAAFLVLAGVYAIVHGLVYLRRHQSSTRSSLTPQTDLAILNWRRERSVFLGTNQPQEDASWIFQLRMAELERAKSGRTSEPRPWHRLAARMFDYAIWGLVLALLLSQVRAMGIVSDQVAQWLMHPLLAPVVITASWIPIEALLITAVGTTPGKWLFGIYLQFSISDAYARRNTMAQLTRGIKRAVRVWFEGVACGFPLLAPVLVAVAYEKLAENQETDWDFAADCLVTHGPAGVVNTITGVCGLASMMWLYGVAWQQPMAESIAWTRSTIAEALPSSATVKGKLNDATGQLDRLIPALPAMSPSQPAKEAIRATPAPVPSPVAPAAPRARRCCKLGDERRGLFRPHCGTARADRCVEDRWTADAAFRQCTACRRAVSRMGGSRSRRSRSVALPGACAASARSSPGRAQFLPQGEAARPDGPLDRRRHRQRATRHRGRFPQPLPTLTCREPACPHMRIVCPN